MVGHRTALCRPFRPSRAGRVVCALGRAERTVGSGTEKVNIMKKAVTTMLLSSLFLSAFAAPADPPRRCRNDNLKGLYIFSATGMQRPGGPGTPWIPKAILELLQFGGDGVVTTPLVTIANPPPFDLGNVAPLEWPAPGSNGVYEMNEDCSGTVRFSDAGERHVPDLCGSHASRGNDLDDPDQSGQQRVPGRRQTHRLTSGRA